MARRLIPYRVKVIRSGHVVEVYRYGVTLVRGAVLGSGGGRKAGVNEGRYRELTVHRARERIRRLINANFGEHSKFVTFTFRDNRTDIQSANHAWHRFVGRLRRRYPGFKYLAVIEFQQRGAVHYHMITDLPFVPKARLAAVWGEGFIRINDIRHVDNIGVYVTKYMHKDTHDSRLKGHRAYLASRGLVEPQEEVGEAATGLLRALTEDKKVFERRYTSEHTGSTTYQQYNLRRASDTLRDTPRDTRRRR